jgi:hypothetical protein
MVDVEWQPLPALWPEPAVWTDVGELMLLALRTVCQPGKSGVVSKWVAAATI